MVKSKSKFSRQDIEPHSIMALIVVVLVIVSFALTIVSIVSAHKNNLTRIETTQAVEMSKVSSQKQKPVTKPQRASKQIVAKKTEQKPKVDPNGCEAKGMYWRADNYQCIPKAQLVAPATKTMTPSTGSGDCSLVNGYDWPRTTAMRVCMQESGGNPNNANWADDHRSWAGCMGSFGLMQINCSYGRVFDGARNMAIAYSMWKAAGNSFWQDWPNTCRKVGC